MMFLLYSTGWRWAVIVATLIAALILLVSFRTRFLGEPARKSTEPIKPPLAWAWWGYLVSIAFALLFFLLLRLAPDPAPVMPSRPNIESALARLQEDAGAQQRLLQDIANDQDRLAEQIKTRQGQLPSPLSPAPVEPDWRAHFWLALGWIVGGGVCMIAGLYLWFDAQSETEK